MLKEKLLEDMKVSMRDKNIIRKNLLILKILLTRVKTKFIQANLNYLN